MRFCLVFWVSLVCVACQPKKVNLNDHSQSVDWQMVAKMYINNGQDAGSGKLVWQEIEGEVEAHFVAPLGQGSWSLYERSIEVHDANDHVWRADSMDQLLLNHLGVAVPWEKLKGWVKGIWPDRIQYNEDQTSASFEYLHWQVELTKLKVVNGQNLPQRLTMKKGKQVIKISVKSWHI